jgi:hypothetical protein
MKTSFALAVVGAILLGGGTAFAQGSAVIIKQRAKEIRDQNNVQQGVPSPSQPSRPAASGSTAPSALLQQSLAKVKADLAAIPANSPITATQKLQLAKDLQASAQGAGKPSPATSAALADSLAAAFAQKPLSDTDRNRLVSDLAAVLNPAKIQAAQMQAIYADIQAIFQVNGMARKDAVKIVDQVKAVAAETQRPAG